MKTHKQQRTRTKKRMDHTFEQYIADLLTMHKSIMADKQRVDTVGLDREMIIRLLRLAAVKFSGLSAAISDDRKREALSAATHLKNLLDLFGYAAASHLEETE